MIADAELLSPAGIVGAGRLGSALARGLAAAGVEVRPLAGRETAAAGLGTEDRRGLAALLLAVPDGALAALAERVAATLEGTRPIVLHLSGVLDSSVLAPLRAAGCATGSCHPLQTFPHRQVSPEAFEGVTFGVEGDPDAVRAARAVAALLRARAVEIEPGAKALYHLAAVLAGNGTVALVAAACDAMRAAGLTERQALDALAPLARRSLEGALERGPAAALSGPVARGDRETLERHRAAIDAWDRSRRALYDALVAEQERLVDRERT